MTGMTPERLAEIRARAEVGTGVFDFTCPSCGSAPGVRCYGNGPMPVAMTHQSRHALVDAVKQSAVIDRLELVAEVERLRVFIRGTRIAALAAERDALARQIEKVRALHFAVVPADWLGGPTRCGGCGENYPCRTIHALDA